MNRTVRNEKIILSALLFFFGILLLGILSANHYFLRTYAFDFSAYNFAFFDYAHFKISPCPIYLFPYSITFLQDHFSLTLMFLSPLYWIMQGITGTYSLLIIQTLIVLGGGLATYKLIHFKSANFSLAILSLVYYFILLGRITASVADCNLAIIGAAVVPVFLYYFDLGKKPQAIACFLFLIFNREDFSLWLIFICGFMALYYRKDRLKLKWSLVYLFASFLFFIIIFKFIIPALEDENKKYTLFNFVVLGANPAEAILFLVKHPLQAIGLLFTNHSGSNYFDGIKEEFYLVFFISGGLLLLFRPIFIIPFLPLIAKKMYNDEPIRWSIESYYTVEIVSILPIMIFLIIIGLKNEKLKIALASFICLLTLFVTSIKINRPPEKHIAQLGDTRKFNFLNKDFYKADYSLSEIYGAMAMIPDTAAVSASGKLTTHLALRKKIYHFPRVDDAEYVFVMKKNDNWPVSQGKADTVRQELVSMKGWKILSEKKDFVLLKK